MPSKGLVTGSGAAFRGPLVVPSFRGYVLLLCLILWFNDCKTPASTAAITSIAASSSSSVIPDFLASARRRSTHGSQSRIIATVRPMSIFSRSLRHSTA
jgi:hypothetical protein